MNYKNFLEKLYFGHLDTEVFRLIKSFFLGSRWHNTFAARPMQQAARASKSLARRIRYMVLFGILRYRENVFTRQYFLRRITYLSLYLFAIVSMLARIEAARRGGDCIEEDLKLLELFLEQARQVKRNFRLLPSREECLNDDIMPLIIPEEQYDANEIALRSKLSAVTAIKAKLKK
ncbi:MAG: hypothetical protein PVG70_11185 [Desulfobacterales bacterium]|jgi:acyl-CoA dehydrogenase family protein 9